MNLVQSTRTEPSPKDIRPTPKPKMWSTTAADTCLPGPWPLWALLGWRHGELSPVGLNRIESPPYLHSLLSPWDDLASFLLCNACLSLEAAGSKDRSNIMCPRGLHVLYNRALHLDSLISLDGSLLPASLRMCTCFMRGDGS